jgi:hypothetical protein
MEESARMSEQSKLVRKLIEERFEKYVMGQKPDLTGYNARHDGAEGDWLTKKMGLSVNGKNEPDFQGFEMKKDSPKTTFGDWSPDYALYLSPKRGTKSALSRSEFLRIFGTPKQHKDANKNGRHSWSGEVFPTVKGINKYGQVMRVEESGDIKALYFYKSDQRTHKATLVPKQYQIEGVVLAHWTSQRLRLRLERKFNQLGWFKCLKDVNGHYSKLQFGRPISYEDFLKMVATGDVFCDCGMYDGNSRPYMTWRANHHIWDYLSE